MVSLENGERGTLPRSARLSCRSSLRNHLEQAVCFCRCHAGIQQSLPRRWDQLSDELCARNCLGSISAVGWPGELSGQSVLRGTVEAIVGALKGHCIGPMLVLRG